MQGRREALAVGLVWLVWLAAIILTVAIGLAAGAYTFTVGWTIHTGLWPLFAVFLKIGAVLFVTVLTAVAAPIKPSAPPR